MRTHTHTHKITKKTPLKASNKGIYLGYKRPGFRAWPNLKQTFQFELPILTASALNLRFQSQPHFKARSHQYDSQQDKGRMTETKFSPKHGELSTPMLSPPTTTVWPWVDKVILWFKTNKQLDKEECNPLEEGAEEFGATLPSVLAEH